ncbi:hypothetical protein [Ruegeria sp. HKCCD7318]|uniref:hypothetical protein n=1 Tax=Ruegeria sp. HKCCD7318 TaxID=2683014 RepID=UPI0014922164|nr:hypothetical protein [Ruegeria sp. HKCCD7318]NOE35794.1 hypothetical protein [Ruegeria sp. HKCCD7318]
MDISHRETAVALICAACRNNKIGLLAEFNRLRPKVYAKNARPTVTNTVEKLRKNKKAMNIKKKAPV